MCLLALPLCAVWIRPWVELGIIDDWSYNRTAQLLAETGHIVYNGWATAMLGWQLFFGAALIKVFGFSFAVTRVGTLVVAMATAAVMQRTLVRFGITAWNSAAATLVVLLSPVYLAATFSFMSDIYGLLALVGCCYCCVRALQATGERSVAVWVCVAALGNVVAGSARQIAWLGLLVMVPCTLWLLRKRRVVLWSGVICVVAGTMLVALTLRWYSRQPYALPERVLPPDWHGMRFFLVHMLPFFVRLCVSEVLLLAMPLLLLFTPTMSRTRRTLVVSGGLILLGTLLSGYLFEVHKVHKLARLCVPYLYNSLWYTGFEEFSSYLGHPPLLLTPLVRAVVTALLFLGGLGFACAIWLGPRAGGTTAEEARAELGQLDTKSMYVLLVPVGVAYLLLLLPRHLSFGMLDRYFLFPEFLFLVFAMRVYQRNVRTELPGVVWGLIAVMAVLDVGGMHDVFALYRAQASLLQRIADEGVPRTEIDGGEQYDSWTELMTTGYVNDFRIETPRGAYRPVPEVWSGDPCRTYALDHELSVHGRYVVSFDPKACGGPSQVPPVTYTTFYAPHTRTMYAVIGPYGVKP